MACWDSHLHLTCNLFKLSVSHLIGSDRVGYMCVLVCVCECMCELLWLDSCLERGNIMYPISPTFYFVSRGELTEQPSTFQLFYWAEMYSMAWHITEIPPNYACHVDWSCPPWYYGPTKWFMFLLSWMDATPMILQNYEEGLPVPLNNQYWYEIYPFPCFICTPTLRISPSGTKFPSALCLEKMRTEL